MTQVRELMGHPVDVARNERSLPLPTEQSILRPAPPLLLRLHDHRGLLPPRRRRRFVLRDPLGRAERQTLQILRLKANKAP